MRICVEFSRDARARYVSHLDMQRAVMRWMRRAGLPAEYTQGFNPHIILSFAAPMPVGLISDAECFETRLTANMLLPDITDAMNAVAPTGLFVTRCGELPEGEKKLMAAVRYAGYRIFCERPKEAVPQKNEMLLSFEAQEGYIDAVMAFGGAGTLKPAAVMESAGVTEYEYKRTGLFLCDGEAVKPLFSLCEGGYR